MSITIFIVAITVGISLLAFSRHSLIDELVFWPYRMWRNNEWHRLVSCGFIHGDLGHLAFNMIALYSFGTYVEQAFYHLLPMGLTLYILMYFLAVATADIYNLYTKKNDYSYRSLGASGGVSAIVFSSILLNPLNNIGIFFIIEMPAIVFGVLYLAYCVYMAKRGQDNIGHVAHFTGAIIGFVFPLLFRPSLIVAFITQIQDKIQSWL